MLRVVLRIGLAALVTLAACSKQEPEPLVIREFPTPTPAPPAATPTAVPTPLPTPAPLTVILVRHGEKAEAGGKDPTLSPAGRARAQVLVHMFGKSGIRTIYATHFRRTQETVEPLARLLGLEVQVLEAPDVDGLVQHLLEGPGGTVLVCGHSDSVTSLVEKLGGGSLPEIDLQDFDDLYILSIDGNGTRVLPMQYGAPTLVDGG